MHVINILIPDYIGYGIFSIIIHAINIRAAIYTILQFTHFIHIL